MFGWTGDRWLDEPGLYFIATEDGTLVGLAWARRRQSVTGRYLKGFRVRWLDPHKGGNVLSGLKPPFWWRRADVQVLDIDPGNSPEEVKVRHGDKRRTE